MKKLVLLLILSFACLFVVSACDEKEDNNQQQQEQVDYEKELTNSLDFLKGFYADKFNNNVALTQGNYELIGKSGKCEVIWTVAITSGPEGSVTATKKEDGKYLIEVAEKPAVDILYTLTATVKAENGATKSISYQCKVAKYEVMSYADYAATEIGDPVVVRGIVTDENGKLLLETTTNMFCLTK